MCIPRATVSAVSCLVVPAFICIDLLISRVLKIGLNDDDDDDDEEITKILCQNSKKFSPRTQSGPGIFDVADSREFPGILEREFTVALLKT